MSNKPSRPKARTAPAKGAPMPPPPASPRSNLLWLWIALGAVVVLIGVIAFASAGDDEELDRGVPTETAGGSSGPNASQGEVWPVTITGTPLEAWPRDGNDPAIGGPAPGLSGFTFDGTPMTVDPAQGPVMLVFLAHWCPHCNREIPELLEWKASGAVPPDLQVIGVTTAVDPARENYPPSSWIVDKGWDWPVLADSEANDAAVAMGVSSFPLVVIIGTDGTVLERWGGEKGADGIQELVDAALA